MSDQGRTLEQGADRGDVRAFERNLGEAVLGDLNVGASGPHLLAQTLHLGDGQAGIVRHDNDRRLGEDVVQGRDGLFLFRSIHGCSSPVGGLCVRLLHMPRRANPKDSSAATTCACPRSWANPAPDRRFEPLFPSGKAPRFQTRSSPSMLAPPLFGAFGIKRSACSLRAPAVSDRTRPERTQRFSLPSSGLSAAPAPTNLRV